MKRAIIITSIVLILLGGATVGVQFVPKIAINNDESVVSSENETLEENVATSETISQTITVSNAVSNAVSEVVADTTSEMTADTATETTTPKRRRFQTVNELPGATTPLQDNGLDGISTLDDVGLSQGVPYTSTTSVSPSVSQPLGVSNTFSATPTTLTNTDRNSSTGTIMVHSTQRAVENGLIIPIYEVDVPAEEAGVLRELYVEDFEQVQKNQKLVQLDDRQSVMAVSVAEAKKESAAIQMNNNVNVRYAKAAYDVSDAEVKQADATNKKVPNSVTITEYNRLVLSRTQAFLQIEQAQQELKVATQTYNVQSAELDAAKLNLTKFEVHCPHDGVIMELYRKEGEWLKPGDPIVRLVQMNPIRYSFRIESKTPPESIFNQPVTIHVPSIDCDFQGKVTYIKPSHDIGDMYQVWVDIENRWQAFSNQDSSAKQKGYWILQPGMRAEVKKIGK